jgi:hypothetical protein
MKAFLMHPDRDFDLQRELPPNEAALTQDLELNTLFLAMANGDQFLFDMAKRAVLSSLTDPGEIVYRQHVLTDCLAQPDVVRGIYNLTIEAIEGERKIYGWFGDTPNTILGRSVQVLELFVGVLKRLRRIADEQSRTFRSEGFTRFFAMLEQELDDAYMQTVERRLNELKFRHGILMSAQLGQGNKGINYVLRELPPEPSWWKQLTTASVAGFSFEIPERDENGFRALSELRDRGVNLAANVVTQSADHILSFFRLLRAELAFYIGCLNLQQQLAAKSEPVCFPIPVARGSLVLSAQGLYDVSLALHLDMRVVGNDVDADAILLMLITGANQGGKSTFLRSVGLAQLMMQCGMFAPAGSFRANVCDGIFTHYKREEDPNMKSGKLDEELSRMSEIADWITPNAMLLCNESFAATNEREGSEIARQVVRAMTDAGVKVLLVTHLYDLAHGFYREGLPTALFLRAEREPDGRRTYRLQVGEPLPTSFGADSYRQVFGAAPGAEAEALVAAGR